MNSPRLILPAPVCAALLYLSMVSCDGQGWKPATGVPTLLWSRIACSADGTLLLALSEDADIPCWYGAFISTNSGITFDAIPDEVSGSDVSGSADGTKWIVASAYCGDLIVPYSPAQGWQLSTQLNVKSSLVASSADGIRLAAAGQYSTNYSDLNSQAVLISTNSGGSWQSVLTNVFVNSIACSADGSTLAATTPTNVVYTSTNFGVTWSTNLVDSQWFGDWNSVAAAACGASLFAASDDGVFVSGDAGSTWARISSPDSFQSIAVSADGTQLVAAAKAGVVYTSTNAGVNWTLSSVGDPNAVLTTVTLSADGSRIFAAVQGGLIYSLQAAPPPPFLKLVPSGTNLNLSWPFPSKDFLLQQATNLGASAWMDVTAEPSLSLTTLQNQLTLPAPTQPVFYRLAAYRLVGGTFQNLDFESADVVSNGYPFIQFGPAFPGWTGYIGTNQVGAALYNTIALDSAAIGLQTNTAGTFDGRYYASIEAGFVGNPGQPSWSVASSYLSQTALLPANARSIRFKASGDDFVLSLNGQALTVVPLGGALFGANLANFGGAKAELRFTALPTPAPRPPVNILFLDSISFSARQVP